MKTTKRIDYLESAVRFAVEENFNRKVIIADIATDHGYIAEKISRQDYAGEVIATDISAKSLKKLENLIEFHHLSGINCVLGDGLNAIERADIAVIAGIGGMEIIKMLANQNKNSFGNNKCDIFVLQPAQNVVELRKFIFDNKIFLIKDFMFQDKGRFYSVLIIDVSKTKFERQSIYNLFLGRDNSVKNPDFEIYLKEIIEFSKFLKNIPFKRIKTDKVLYQKYKLNKLACKLLKIRRSLC